MAFFGPNSSNLAFFESGWPSNFAFGFFLVSGIFLAFLKVVGHKILRLAFFSAEASFLAFFGFFTAYLYTLTTVISLKITVITC